MSYAASSAAVLRARLETVVARTEAVAGAAYWIDTHGTAPPYRLAQTALWDQHGDDVTLFAWRLERPALRAGCPVVWRGFQLRPLPFKNPVAVLGLDRPRVTIVATDRDAHELLIAACAASSSRAQVTTHDDPKVVFEDNLHSALLATGGNVAAAARVLGCPVRTVWARIARLKIDLAAYRTRP